MTDFGSQSSINAYRTVADEPARVQSRDAEASLLSSRAEDAKLKVATDKQAAASRLETMAALNKSRVDNANEDMSSIEGQLKIFDGAIKNTRNPEIQLGLFKDRDNLQTNHFKAIDEAGKAREELRASNMEHVNENFNLDPSTGGESIKQLGKSQNNPALFAFGAMLKGEVGIPKFNNKKYSELSSTQQQTFKDDILRGLAPKQGEMMLRDRANEAIRLAEIERQMERDKVDKADKESRAAALRDKTEGQKAIKEQSDELKRQALILRHENAIDKIMKEEPTVKNPDYVHHYVKADEGEPTIPNPRIKVYQDAIDKLNGVTSDTEKPKGTGTKDDPIKL